MNLFNYTLQFIYYFRFLLSHKFDKVHFFLIYPLTYRLSMYLLIIIMAVRKIHSIIMNIEEIFLFNSFI